MTEEVWIKTALIDYFPSILDEIKGEEVLVEIYQSRYGEFIDIEIRKVKNK